MDMKILLDNGHYWVQVRDGHDNITGHNWVVDRDKHVDITGWWTWMDILTLLGGGQEWTCGHYWTAGANRS